MIFSTKQLHVSYFVLFQDSAKLDSVKLEDTLTL